MPLLNNAKIDGLLVYLEKRKTRQYVGRLYFDEAKLEYVFVYDKQYLYSDNIIPLGPELPLTQQSYQSKTLFPSLTDRIPSRQNPAYVEYCDAMGIARDESDPIILLASIGKRGPSSFVFEPHYSNNFDGHSVKSFRLDLGLTTREFSQCFDITQAALVRIEKGSSGNELLKRLELYYKFPQVALYQISKSGGSIHTDKIKKLIRYFKDKIDHESV